MIDETHYFYFYIATMVLTFVVAVVVVAKSSYVGNTKPLPPEQKSEARQQWAELSFWQRLNWGALLYTPLWLLVNGYWIRAVFAFLLYQSLPLLGLIISVVLFFLGSYMAWSKPNRWRSFDHFIVTQQNTSAVCCGYLILTAALQFV